MGYKTDTHIHTKESSNCSNMRAEEIIELYKEAGYSSLVTTDHCAKSKFDCLGNMSWKEKIDYLYNGYEIANRFGKEIGINVMFATEITLVETDSDYLVYGITKDFLYANEELYNIKLEELSKICRENDWLLVQAHPFRGDIQLAPLELIDGIEVFNGEHDEISRNEKASEYGNRTDKILTSGSDIHNIEDLGRGGIITEVEITNIEQFINILRDKEYRIVVNGKQKYK